jgi:peptidoglycan/xylan/chitin deacetylase (PgdA/CDA1 family)
MSDRTLVDKLAGRANRLSARLARTRTVRMVNERPIVSFTFDDFPKSAVRNGAAILERRGVAGTYYLSRSFSGAIFDGIEYYDLADLQRLIDNGHEIGCHTASHLHVPQVARSRLVEDLDANAKFLRGHFGGLRMTTFAFPFGDLDLRTKLLLQRRFVACRSTLPGANRGVADLGALRAERLYTRLASADAVQSLIERSAQPRSWLILYTHDVDDDPSPHGCTPALLEAAVEGALSAGCELLPVRDALGPIRFHP